MEFEFKTKNKVAANLIKELIKNNEIRETLDRIASIHAGTGINYLAEVYGFDNGDEDSTYDIYVAVHKGSGEDDIIKITLFDASNIFDAVKNVCKEYDASAMGITLTELILSYLDGYAMEDIAGCLGWSIDDDVNEEDNYIYVKKDSYSKEWVRCEEGDARYKIAL